MNTRSSDTEPDNGRVIMKLTFREPKASRINKSNLPKELSLLKLPQPPSNGVKICQHGVAEIEWNSSASQFITNLKNRLNPNHHKGLKYSDLVNHGVTLIEVFSSNGIYCKMAETQADTVQHSGNKPLRPSTAPQPNLNHAQFHPLPNRQSAYSTPLQRFVAVWQSPSSSSSSSSSSSIPPLTQAQPIAGPDAYSIQSPSYMSHPQIHPPIKRKRAPEDQGDNSRRGEPPSTSTDPVPTPVPSSSSEPDPSTSSPLRKDAHKEVQVVQLYQALHSLEAELACEKEARSKAEAELSKVKLAEEEARLRAEDMSRRLEETRAQSERDLENTEMALKDVQRALRESEEARKKSEDALEDLKREIKEPFVVPALLEAFGMVSAMTSAVRDKLMGAE